MKTMMLFMFVMSPASFRESEIVFETMWNGSDENAVVVEQDGFDPTTKTFYAKLKRR